MGGKGLALLGREQLRVSNALIEELVKFGVKEEHVIVIRDRYDAEVVPVLCRRLRLLDVYLALIHLVYLPHFQGPQILSGLTSDCGHCPLALRQHSLILLINGFALITMTPLKMLCDFHLIESFGQIPESVILLKGIGF